MKKLTVFVFCLSFCMSISVMALSPAAAASPIVTASTVVSAIPQTKKPGLLNRLAQKLIERKFKKLYRKADQEKGEGLALTSLILGALSLVFLFLGVEVLFFAGIGAAIAAIILGFVSKKKGGGKDWKAIVGISLGFTTILLLLIAIAIVAAFIAAI
ncbi:MAG: hypothetical protein K2X48_07150 [Chitinophagaceae bacterium]|nr:hypothetical protein [Chitinophagaceae bacterium]